MKQRKYISNGHTFIEVTFTTGENDNIIDEKPTTHTATVIDTGRWFFCFCIDGKLADSLSYRSAKTAVKNAWFVED